MEDTVKNDVLEIARLLDDHRAEQVRALYIGDMSDWTDYFIITTVRSAAHLKGLLRLLNEAFSEKSITPLRSAKAHSRETGWVLIDCGDVGIHIFQEETRDYYRLEELWSHASVIDIGALNANTEERSALESK